MAFKFTHWPTESWGYITQNFGENRQYYSQFGPEEMKLKGHDGIDFYAPKGSRIFAVAPGKVSDINQNGRKPSGRPHNYGIFVRIDHEGGYQTTYAHLQEALVDKGAKVLGGQLIGLADNTGNIKSGDSHLHLTLKRFPFGDRGWPYNIVNPKSFIADLLAKGPEAYPEVAAVIGKLGDVERYKNKPGYICYIDQDRYSLEDNLKWVDSILEGGYPILIVSDPRKATGVFKLELAKILGLTLQEEEVDKVVKRRRLGRGRKNKPI